jgi:hypothetical protein
MADDADTADDTDAGCAVCVADQGEQNDRGPRRETRALPGGERGRARCSRSQGLSRRRSRDWACNGKSNSEDMMKPACRVLAMGLLASQSKGSRDPKGAPRAPGSVRLNVVPVAVSG